MSYMQLTQMIASYLTLLQNQELNIDTILLTNLEISVIFF